MRFSVSQSRIVSNSSSSSEGGLLTFIHSSSNRVPSMGGSTLQSSTMWVPPMGCISSQTSKMQVPSTGHSPSGTDSSGDSHEVTSPASKYAVGWAPLFMAPGWASQRVTVSCRYPSAPLWGYPGATGGSLLQNGPPWAAGGQHCLSMVYTLGCSSCSLYLLSLLLHWLQSCLSYTLPPLSDCSCTGILSPSLK